ncbi:Mitochondrial ribosomal subunit protein [Teratosphaeria destructans]|uniref:Mitochondrial ribosomal subunit protein n=1 Tax=Teratosphaeria destructans TaxID=418781 RepID=A0A9W7SNU9_9PEZI|nr:Mitochondrial ribosomal subunit protein [Teratosphaeria destructans]
MLDDAEGGGAPEVLDGIPTSTPSIHHHYTDIIQTWPHPSNDSVATPRNPPLIPSVPEPSPTRRLPASLLPRGNSSAADPVYEEDDISSLGHAELDQHRELREMLAALHRPADDHTLHRGPLRWRYTTYMGEQHPAANKVVVTFKPADITALTDAQRQTFLKLVGVRYNPVSGLVKMSCESFPSQAQNKRYLASTIRALIAESQDPNADSFADLPLDTRHVKVKPRPRFPERWLVTEERRRELDEKVKKGVMEEAERVEGNRVVSGILAIEAARQAEVEKLEEPVLPRATAPLERGKVGRREVGQLWGSNRW